MSGTVKGDGGERVVLVTGAAQRLGRAIALDFGKRGWTVAAHARTIDERVLSVIGEIEAAGGRGRAFGADLEDIGQVQALMPAVARALGPPECLVNNASVFDYDDIATLEPKTWDRQIAVNLRAPVFLTQAMAAQLPSGKNGVVVNIIDQRVWKPNPHFLSYAASKAGLLAMTKTLAQALAPRVRVNAIGPGPMIKSVHQSDADFEAQWRSILLQRPTALDEIAAGIQFTIAAPAMTGQMIALDGGQHLAWKTEDIGDGHG